MTKHFLICFLMGGFICGKAQEPIQVIRGKVVNEASQLPVSGATVTFSGNDRYTAITDSTGSYERHLPYGKYHLQVKHGDYKVQRRHNVVLVAGKQQVQDFELSEFKIDLDTVNVQADEEHGSAGLDMLNTQRFAGVFYDPARVANSHAGVINADDQANHLTVHGTSPNYIQWKMEGVEIVNPNHLENAGTINDRPALNGGGVSLFSAQLLQNSHFNFAPTDAVSGNALSGLFDMKLRRGNDEKTERIIQASLLGTDVCLEGPFSPKYKGSYLINLRYSTVGILSAIGVNFGDEKINYGDVSYVLAFPHRRGLIKVFGVAGNSENIFKGKADTVEREIQKDFQNISYNSFTAIQGISFITSLSSASHLKNVIAYSSKKVSRSTILLDSAVYLPDEKDEYSQEKFSSLHYFSYSFTSKLRLKAGSYLNYFINEINATSDSVSLVHSRVSDPILQPFVAMEGSIAGKLEIHAGLHGLYQERMGYFNLQPKFRLKYLITERQHLSLHYGAGAQTQPPQLVTNGDRFNQVAPTLSQAFALNHHLRIKKVLVKSEAFYQYYSQVPVQSANGFSAFNYFNETVLFPLSSEGKARVYGLDVTVDQNYKNFYLIISSSVYNSEYSTDGSVYRKSRFNTGYNAVITGGHEFELRDHKKFFGINLRGVVRNGFMETQDTALAAQFAYTRELPQYYRFDLRISYRKNRNKSSYIWGLDIQNVTNRQNVSYHYYDRFTRRVETRYQLGLIPVLSFKVLF